MRRPPYCDCEDPACHCPDPDEELEFEDYDLDEDRDPWDDVDPDNPYWKHGRRAERDWPYGDC